MQAKQRTLKRLGIKLKRALKSQPEPEPKKIATLADIQNKLQNYQKTQGPADFTGPQVIKEEADS